MANHTLRGVMSAWLGLIALQTIASSGGSGRITSFFTDVDRLVKRALDPTVPAIPDRRAKPVAGGYGPIFNMTPEQLADVAKAVGNAPAGAAAASGQNPLLDTLSGTDYSGLGYLNPNP